MEDWVVRVLLWGVGVSWGGGCGMRGGGGLGRRGKKGTRRQTYGGGKGSECVREFWRVDKVLVSWDRRWRVCSRVLSSLSERGGRGIVAIFGATKRVGGTEYGWSAGNGVDCSRLSVGGQKRFCKIGGGGSNLCLLEEKCHATLETAHIKVKCNLSNTYPNRQSKMLYLHAITDG